MYSKETLIKIVLLALLIYSVVEFAEVRSELSEAAALQETLNVRLCELKDENRLLNESSGRGYDEEEIERLAREKFSLVFPGEKLFYFLNNSDREE